MLWFLGLTLAVAQGPIVWVDTVTQVEATDLCAFYDIETGVLEDFVVIGKAYDTINANFQYVMSINHFGYDAVNRDILFYSQNSFWSLNGVYGGINYFTTLESAFCFVEDSFLVLNGGSDTIGQILVIFSGISSTGLPSLIVHRLIVNRGVNKSLQSDSVYLLPVSDDISVHYSNRYGASALLTVRSLAVSDVFQVSDRRWLILLTWSGALAVPSNPSVLVRGWSIVELRISPTNGSPQADVLYTSPVHNAAQTRFGQPIEIGAPYRGGSLYGFSRRGPFAIWQSGDKVIVSGVFGNSVDTMFLDFLGTKNLPALPNGLGTVVMVFDTLTYSLQDYLAILPSNHIDSVDVVPMGLLFDSTVSGTLVKLWYGWASRGDKPIDSLQFIFNGGVSKRPAESLKGIKAIYLLTFGGTMEYGAPFQGGVNIEGIEGFASGEAIVGGVVLDSAYVPRWFQYKRLVALDTVTWLSRFQISGNSPYGYVVFSRGDPDFRGGGLRQIIPIGDGTVLALGMTARWDLEDNIEFWIYDIENDVQGVVPVKDIYNGSSVRTYFDFLRYGGSWWIALLPCGTNHPVWDEVGLLYDTIGCNVYLMGPQYSFPPYDIKLYGHPPMDSMVLIAPGGCRYKHPGPYAIWLADTLVMPTTVSCNIISAQDSALIYYLYTPEGVVDSSTTGQFEIQSGGTYWIIGLDSCGVKISDSISIEILKSAKQLTLKGVPLSKGGSYVLFGPHTVVNAAIMDVYGRKLPVEIMSSMSQDYCDGKEYLVKIPPLPPGIYIISIEGKTKQFVTKIVIE